MVPLKALAVTKGSLGRRVAKAMNPERTHLEFAKEASSAEAKIRSGEFDVVVLDSAAFDSLRSARTSEAAVPAINYPARRMLPILHDPSSGRLDAKRIAEYLGVPVSSLARALGKKTAAVHKSPAAASLQDELAPIARTVGILQEFLRSPEEIRAWLNSPHPDLGNETPMSLLLDGKGVGVADMLEAALAGDFS
ncbi:MAG: antitoxin Xre/MbcA/ParS toxin-binding domain-containing protein [Acidobacteriota bacterium]